MSLYNWYLTHPFGPGPSTIEVIYLNTVGGTRTDLDSEPTTGSPDDGTELRFVVSGNLTLIPYQLVASNHAHAPPDWIRPLDYSDTNNAKVWKRIQCYGAGGAGGVALIVGETPSGAINGSNKDYTTANGFQIETLSVFVNGLHMRAGPDFTITGTQNFQMVQALLTGDSLSVDYVLS